MTRRLFSAPFFVLLLTGLFMACFLVWPLCLAVREAFESPGGGFTMEYVTSIFGNPLYTEGLVNSFKMAVGSTVGSLLLAVPLAVLAARFDFRGKSILTSLLLLPLVLPPFVGVIGIKHLLGQHGALNAIFMHLGLMDTARPVDWLGSGRLAGVIITNSLHLYPILYLNVTAALANQDPALDEAAENMGCAPRRRFFRVTLPLAMPGILAGTSIVFIAAFNELGVPLLFDYSRVTSVQIYQGALEMGGSPLPYALVVVMVCFSLLFFLITKVAFGRHDYAGTGRASMASRAVVLTGRRGGYAVAAFVAVIVLAALPHGGVLLAASAGDWYDTVLPSSFTLDHYRDALGHSLTVPSIQNSLKYAGLATVMACVLGVGVAWVTVRTKLPGRHLVDSLTMLPLAVPGMVLAFGYLVMTRPGQPFEWMLLGSGNPLLLLTVAYCVRRLTYVVRGVSAGLQQTSVSLEEAAQSLGCPPWKTLLKITLPLVTASLIAGALFAFAFSMLEVSDSMILAQKREHFPIPKAIYELNGNLGNGESLASALGVWAMVFLAVTLTGASLVMGKRMGALFKA